MNYSLALCYLETTISMLIFGLPGWPVAVAVAVAVADGLTGFVFFGAKILVSTLSSNVTDRDSRPGANVIKLFTAVIYEY